MTKATLSKGRYYDSVTLMAVARKLLGCRGVRDAAAVMGTDSNKAILKGSGLLTPQFASASDSDLLIAVRADAAADAAAAMGRAEELLKAARSGPAQAASSGPRPRSLQAAVEALPGANLAIVSVAGKYAADEAMACLRQGLHVMIFSDNVPLEREIELKRFAAPRGLLVMGPDCGTAIINGAPLGFANVVPRGSIGIVAAAGTGLQEASCVIANAGAGVSQAIGTGGRDVKKEVGGIMFLQGLRALLEDHGTKVVLLVSKPPHPAVLASIAREARRGGKPVVAVLLGSQARALESCGLVSASTLEEAALLSVALSRGEDIGAARRALDRRDAALRDLAAEHAAALSLGQRFARGLFSGGTFCAEAQAIFRERVRKGFSNAPLEPYRALKDSWRSVGHSFVDLGEDEFTQGRPHPMIDYSVRNKRLLAEAADASVAVIQLDVVLGHGSNMAPGKELAPAIEQALSAARKARRRPAIVVNVTGTAADPQGKSSVEAELRRAGAILQPSNAAASRLSRGIIEASCR